MEENKLADREDGGEESDAESGAVDEEEEDDEVLDDDEEDDDDAGKGYLCKYLLEIEKIWGLAGVLKW